MSTFGLASGQMVSEDETDNSLGHFAINDGSVNSSTSKTAEDGSWTSAAGKCSDGGSERLFWDQIVKILNRISG